MWKNTVYLLTQGNVKSTTMFFWLTLKILRRTDRRHVGVTCCGEAGPVLKLAALDVADDLLHTASFSSAVDNTYSSWHSTGSAPQKIAAFSHPFSPAVPPKAHVLSKHSLESFTIIVVVAPGHRCIWDGGRFNCECWRHLHSASGDKINGFSFLDLNNIITTTSLCNLSHKTPVFFCLQFPFFHFPLLCVRVYVLGQTILTSLRFEGHLVTIFIGQAKINIYNFICVFYSYIIYSCLANSTDDYDLMCSNLSNI